MLEHICRKKKWNKNNVVETKDRRWKLGNSSYAITVIAAILIRIAAFSRNFPDLEILSARWGTGEGEGGEIGTQRTCQPVELGRNSVNWTPGGSQTRLRAVAFDARITADPTLIKLHSWLAVFAMLESSRIAVFLPRGRLRHAWMTKG